MRFKTSLVFVGLACSIRPISAIIWVYMLGMLVWYLRLQSRALVSVVLSIAAIGSACVHLSTLSAYQTHGVEF
jgi:phosphatidylinositol glycan class B